MWRIKVLGMEAHGDCPAVENVTEVWVYEVGERLVKMTNDRGQAETYDTFAEADAVARSPLMKYFVLRIVDEGEE